METVQYKTCPVCGHNELSAFLKVQDHSISKQDFQLVSCSECSFTLTQNPPSESEIGPFYSSEDYISHSDTNKGLVNKLYHQVRSYMLGRKKALVNKHIKGKRLLDVGSGTGYFLNHMKEAGYETKGIEVSEEATKIALEKFGLDISPPSELLQKKLKGGYDAITLWHVLEHLYDLNTYMETFHELLNDTGALIIAVPNKNSPDAAKYKDFWAAYDVPRHLWHFTPKTMEKLAKKHGFELKTMKMLPFDAFYNCLLSEKYRGNSMALFGGFINGFFSWLSSLFNVKKASSIVYVLKKKLK